MASLVVDGAMAGIALDALEPARLGRALAGSGLLNPEAVELRGGRDPMIDVTAGAAANWYDGKSTGPSGPRLNCSP